MWYFSSLITDTAWSDSDINLSAAYGHVYVCVSGNRYLNRYDFSWWIEAPQEQVPLPIVYPRTIWSERTSCSVLRHTYFVSPVSCKYQINPITGRAPIIFLAAQTHTHTHTTHFVTINKFRSSDSSIKIYVKTNNCRKDTNYVVTTFQEQFSVRKRYVNAVLTLFDLVDRLKIIEGKVNKSWCVTKYFKTKRGSESWNCDKTYTVW